MAAASTIRTRAARNAITPQATCNPGTTSLRRRPSPAPG
jgi:hypothetical protein